MKRVFITGSANCDPVMAVACAMRAMNESRSKWLIGSEEIQYVTGLSPTGVEAAVRYLHGASLSAVRTIDTADVKSYSELDGEVDCLVIVNVSEVTDDLAPSAADFDSMRSLTIDM